MADAPLVAVVGSGPAVEALVAAVSELEVEIQRDAIDQTGEADLAVVVGSSGATEFRRVSDRVDAPWIAVELGGIGGRPIAELDAAVSVLHPSGGCLECLRTRVASNADGPTDDPPRTVRADARLAGSVAGRIAVAILEGEDRRGEVVELPYAERRLFPVPDCRCDGAAGHDLDRSHRAPSIEDVADMADGAVDPRLGLVREVGEAHSFPAPYYLATLCDTTAFSDAEAGPQAAGVAANWNKAFVKAIGEALERYAAGVYRESAFEVAPAESVDDAVPPSAIVLPEAYEAPDSTEPIPWVPGETLRDGAPVSLPAEFVVFPPPNRRHAPSITTGLGLGAAGVGAILSGLYEVVERDATMLSWYSTIEPLGVTVEDEDFRALERRARSEDLSVTVLSATVDVDVPVLSAAVHREGEWPRFAVGSAADLDPVAAARSALCEALQNWMELRTMGPERAAEDPSAIARYAEFPPEARSFVDPGSTIPASALAPAETPTGTDELDAVLDRLETAGLQAYGARLTTRDVERLGFEVVRVVVPGAQPLFTGDRFFGERARTVPRELGYRPRLDRPPHPYP